VALLYHLAWHRHTLPRYSNVICLSSQRRLLKNGTTTASYFATNHYDGTLALCDIIGELLLFDICLFPWSCSISWFCLIDGAF